MNIEKEVAAMQKLTTGELRDRYAEVFGEAPRSRHKQYLIRRIAWRLQANAEGDLSERARRRAEQLAVDAEVRTTPPKDAHASAPGATTKVEVPVDPRMCVEPSPTAVSSLLESLLKSTSPTRSA